MAESRAKYWLRNEGKLNGNGRAVHDFRERRTSEEERKNEEEKG